MRYGPYNQYLPKWQGAGTTPASGEQIPIPLRLRLQFHPESIRTSLALCALYDNFGEDEEYALALHKAVLDTKQDHFRGDLIKERQIKGGIYKEVCKFEPDLPREEQMKKVEAIYAVVEKQDEYECRLQLVDLMFR